MAFFWLTNSDDFQLAERDQSAHLEDVTCPVNDGHQRRGARIGNLIVKLPQKRGDIVWTWLSNMLINDRVKQLIERANFTGYELKPVTISGILKKKKSKLPQSENEHLPSYWEVVITGWAGMAPPESGIELLESKSCKHCGLLVYSHFEDTSHLIDIAQWDGSDFFMVWPLPKYIFVTERVANFIKEHNLKDCNLIPVEKIPRGDKDLFNALSPGRLSHSMPEDRAHLLGDPLGIF